MARDMGWGELFGSLYYEGHPSLWYFYLKLWTYLAAATGIADETVLHLAHALPILASFWLVIFRFKLPFWYKPLLLLGHFMLFEYGMVDRGYALTILMLFSAAVELTNPAAKPWRLGVFLFLLCQTEVFGVLMAGALVLYTAMRVTSFPKIGGVLQSRTVQLAMAGVVAGLAVFALTVWPRGDEEALSKAYTAPFSAENFANGFQGLFANTFLIGLIPDTNVFGVSGLGLAFSAVVLGLLVYFFWGEHRSLTAFFSFLAVDFLFLVAFYPGGVRQWGMLYVFFLACLHLRFHHLDHLTKPRWGILLLFSACQIYYCSLAITKDVQYPFSQSIHAGRFIKDNVPANVPVVAINRFATAPVGGYAGRPLYFLPTGDAFTYFKWLEKVYLPPERELQLFAEFKGVKGIVVLSPAPLDPKRYPQSKLWKSFDGYNMKNENYFLYLLER